MRLLFTATLLTASAASIAAAAETSKAKTATVKIGGFQLRQLVHQSSDPAAPFATIVDVVRGQDAALRATAINSAPSFESASGSSSSIRRKAVPVDSLRLPRLPLDDVTGAIKAARRSHRSDAAHENHDDNTEEEPRFDDRPLSLKVKEVPMLPFPVGDVTVRNMRRGGFVRSHSFAQQPALKSFWMRPSDSYSAPLYYDSIYGHDQSASAVANRARGAAKSALKLDGGDDDNGSGSGSGGESVFAASEGSAEDLDLEQTIPTITVPDVSDRQTVLSLAAMAANAYLKIEDETKRDTGTNWTVGRGFGWDADGMRGYVFADETNSTVVVAIKGSSLSGFGGDGTTAPLDKLNDNRLFSCCCARVDITWSTVCGCYMKSGRCNQTCIEESLDRDGLDTNRSDLYYHLTLDLIDTIATEYPGANVFLTGHSLGGGVSALVGLTYGLPAIAFQAPGDMMPAQRLHLPMPPALAMHRMPIWHISQNADPVFIGTCTSITSSCYAVGYALESKCHLGNMCVFDTVGKLGWRVDIRTHRLYDVIDKVLTVWEDSEWPSCQPDRNCTDCGSWEFSD